MTAAQLFSLAARNGKRLSELASVMKKYPQVMRNVKVNEKGKLNFYTDDTVREAIEKAKSELGNRGRVVVRVSGTEPLIRIMVEGEDQEETFALAEDTAKKISEKLRAY
jgi:phosphoglucosamine mutase